jgi:hypothetical protein
LDPRAKPEADSADAEAVRLLRPDTATIKATAAAGEVGVVIHTCRHGEARLCAAVDVRKIDGGGGHDRQHGQGRGHDLHTRPRQDLARGL